MATKTRPRRPAPARRKPAQGRGKPAQLRGSRGWMWGALAAAAVIAVLFVVFRANNGGHDATGGGGASGSAAYQVGSPGVGAAAPAFRLDATTGKPASLADYRGRTVLLYFQEGLSCQPCWDQITGLEQSASQLRAAGIDQVLSVTTDPVGLLARKVRDMRLGTPVLSDPDLAVSRAYHANEYGMMGASRDGHTFVLVGPDGVIRWRADYGGAPKYTMYVPVDQLLADLKAGRR